MTVGTTGYATYASSLQTALTELKYMGFTGNTAAAPSFANQTQQFPSLLAIDNAYNAGQITAAQRLAYRQASTMNAQTQIDLAKQTLRQLADPVAGAGDVNAFSPF